jgi:hypothetical protein
MASPNAVFTEMVTTTFRNHASELVDNVSGNNALFRLLKDKGKIQSESGGFEIARPLEYAENGTFLRYSGYDSAERPSLRRDDLRQIRLGAGRNPRHGLWP